jgi:hypothetical protein
MPDYPTTYRDRLGQIETSIHEDRGSLRMPLRGIAFFGNDEIGSFEVVAARSSSSMSAYSSSPRKDSSSGSSLKTSALPSSSDPG